MNGLDIALTAAWTVALLAVSAQAWLHGRRDPAGLPAAHDLEPQPATDQSTPEVVGHG